MLHLIANVTAVACLVLALSVISATIAHNLPAILRALSKGN